MRIDVIWASIPVVVDAAAGVAAAVGDMAVVLADDDGVPLLLLSFLSLPFIDEDCTVVVPLLLAPPPPPPPSAHDDEITAAL